MKLDCKALRQSLQAGVKRCRYVLLVIAVGIALLCWPSAERESASEQAEAAQSQSSDAQEELAALEEKLAAALSQIDGAGEVTVVLTLSSGGKQIYATEEESSQSAEGDSESSTQVARISTGSGTETALEVERLAPVYQGALVICDGGDDSAVRLAITHSVSALTGLGSSQISVCGRAETGG